MAQSHETELEKRRQRRAKRHMDPEYDARQKKQIHDASFKRKYGLTPQHYQRMFEDRDGLCDICHSEETRVIKGKLMPLCVDHDEESGCVRGLLCSNCNVAIGMLAHDVDRLSNAIIYLKGGSPDGEVR
jgi:hypothetical protein